MERASKTVSNIVTNILNKEPEQPVCDIYKNLLSEVKGKLEENFKNMKESYLG